MKLLWSLILLLGGTSSVASEFRHWTDWTQREKIEFATFTALNYTDFAQTNVCLKQYPKCKEANPLYGTNPNPEWLVAGFLVNQIGYYWLIGISEYSDSSKYRPYLLATKIMIVVNNDRQGINISKVW
jgi:hypothetical protein